MGLNPLEVAGAALVIGLVLMTLQQVVWSVRWVRSVERKHFRELSIRADRQHQDYLDGKPSGIYGNFPPANLEGKETPTCSSD